MSDLISRQAAIDEIDEWIKAFRESGHKESAADACLIKDGIIQLPSAQAEIVRCKECKHNCERVDGITPTVELVHPCHHKYRTYGVFDVLHHEPTEEEQLEIKRSLAAKLLPALTDELQVVRCHYPAGERLAEDPLECWTYGVKFTVCHECGKPDIEREDKSFDERGITAMKKALGFAIAEPHIGEPVEVLKLR